MAKYEARVKTAFGEIVVNFDTLEELKSNLAALDVNTASEIIRKKFETVIAIETRKQKPGLEKHYNFTPSSLVELTHIPEALSKPELIAFVLFAYHPEAASTLSISLSSGIKNVTDYLSQTTYKKIWWKTQDGHYMLSDDGLKLVSSKILPKLMATPVASKENPPEAAT
jgi:hypothetical protein